ncbi:signal recognition particle 14kD protein-domain-containing protein [Coprinopsis sp. MPI-PUGE-AT-0042]|nr:signal recognition particle 14kD protein-domain-containing protein [Coprinopsis sp. MPI-PUGE-AT-0042]
MQPVDRDTFLGQLTALFESSNQKGSIWITHKRLTRDGDDAAMKHEEDGSDDTREYPCLLRVTDGKNTKFSTMVTTADLPKFYACVRESVESVHGHAPKTRQEARKASKKMTEPVALDGPKRGAGRRKRQRQLKAVAKQQQSQKKFKEREEARRKAEQAQ